jgi:hypothetical protein
MILIRQRLKMNQPSVKEDAGGGIMSGQPLLTIIHVAFADISIGVPGTYLYGELRDVLIQKRCAGITLRKINAFPQNSSALTVEFAVIRTGR